VTRTRCIMVAVALFAACGGDTNQPLPPRTVVKWTFDAYPDLGFSGDNCADFGITKVQIDLTGPATTSMTGDCGDKQMVFLDLPAGSYTAAMTPLDVDGLALVKAPITLTVAAVDGDSETTANVPWEAWKGTFKGTFYFKVTWGGHDCASASPAVVMQSVKITQGGVATTLTSDTGHKVDGVDSEPCRSADQYVAKLPFGPTTIEIVGKDASNAVQYQKQFEAFTGAGAFNPTLSYDLPGPPDAPMPDAGVDAM